MIRRQRGPAVPSGDGFESVLLEVALRGADGWVQHCRGDVHDHSDGGPTEGPAVDGQGRVGRRAHTEPEV